jgi:tetratricopeptide (TPR) repeat protein
MRVRRRLEERAIEYAALNQWEEAIGINRQLLATGEDANTLNRIGKALFELGRYQESRDTYTRALHLNHANTIARKNLQRLESLIARGFEQAPVGRSQRQQVDLRMFVTETGRTALTTLIDVQRGPVVDALITGEKVELRIEGRQIYVLDSDGEVIGRLEPKLAQRLAELITGGNRYIAAILNPDARHVRVLIREIFQDPSQRGRVSFPGKLGEGAAIMSTMRFEEYEDDVIEEESSDDSIAADDEFVAGDEEEEIGLEEIERDMGDDDDENEE